MGLTVNLRMSLIFVRCSHEWQKRGELRAEDGANTAHSPNKERPKAKFSI